MLVANFVTNHAAMSDTRTYEEFSKFIGSEPHKLGLLTRLYPELTATYLTESLRNVFYNDGGSKNRFQSIDSLYFEWEVKRATSFDLHYKFFKLLEGLKRIISSVDVMTSAFNDQGRPVDDFVKNAIKKLNY